MDESIERAEATGITPRIFLGNAWNQIIAGDWVKKTKSAYLADALNLVHATEPRNGIVEGAWWPMSLRRKKLAMKGYPIRFHGLAYASGRGTAAVFSKFRQGV